jgi:hypothetical protein
MVLIYFKVNPTKSYKIDSAKNDATTEL